MTEHLPDPIAERWVRRLLILADAARDPVITPYIRAKIHESLTEALTLQKSNEHRFSHPLHRKSVAARSFIGDFLKLECVTPAEPEQFVHI